jgi:predicted dehydrogenase
MPVVKQERCLRIGILGCGPIAQFAHLESTQKARNAVLQAVCDADEGLAQRFGTFYDARRIYTDYAAMLADPEVDAVILATSDAFHVPGAIQALAAGKHVLCEKPIALDVAEVLRLQEAVRASGKVLQIGHMLRFDQGIESARDFIRDEMGEMLALKAWYCDSTHRYTNTDAIQPMPILGTRALKPSGDPKANKERYFMLAHGSHLVDLARFLAGPIKTLEARLRKRYGAHCWFIHTEFESGAMGHLELTLPLRMDWHEGFQVYGQNGSVLAKTFNPWYYRSSEVDIFREADGAYHRVLGADGHFYRRQVEGFADTVLDGAPMRGADIEDGVASVRAMAAVAESVRTGREVHVADVTGEV